MAYGAIKAVSISQTRLHARKIHLQLLLQLRRHLRDLLGAQGYPPAGFAPVLVGGLLGGERVVEHALAVTDPPEFEQLAAVAHERLPLEPLAQPRLVELASAVAAIRYLVTALAAGSAISASTLCPPYLRRFPS